MPRANEWASGDAADGAGSLRLEDELICHSRESGNPDSEFSEISRPGFPLSRE